MDCHRTDCRHVAVLHLLPVDNRQASRHRGAGEETGRRRQCTERIGGGTGEKIEEAKMGVRGWEGFIVG
jgi:hypothetical protein